MLKDKYDFMLELIENKKLSLSQKERVLRLAMQEVKKEEIVGKELEERIRRIEVIVKEVGVSNVAMEEDVLYGKHEGNSEEKNFKGKPTFIKEPNPKNVADFMSLFNQRKGLKYLTHDYDEDGTFEAKSFIISANKVFERETKKLNIPSSLWAIVKQFAFDSKQTTWTSISEDYNTPIQVNMGWATKELLNWSKQNKLHPIRNEEYSKMIANFKRITRIEKSNLKKLVNSVFEDIFKNELDDFILETKDIEKADFYSHVGNLKIALEAIFEEIKKHSNSPDKKKISIKYERSSSDEGYHIRQVIITHHNSFPTKELRLLLKEWQEKGNMGKIKEKLKGYCHWSIDTVIENADKRINILRDKDTPEHETIKIKPEGFTHILTFYYK